MSWLRPFTPRRQDADLSEEIHSHLAERIDELMAQGMARSDAESLARRQFGNATLIEETGNDVWRWAALDEVIGDLQYAVRQLLHSKSFALAAILTLALGIGANTAVISVVNAVVLRPLPFPHPDRLLAVEQLSTKGGTMRATAFSYPNYFDVRAASKTLENIATYRDDETTLTGSGSPRHLTWVISSWNLFATLGVNPSLGRSFLASEEKPGQHVVVLSHALWRSQFGRDPSIVGRSITLDRKPYLVVGVAPPDFNFPLQTEQVDVWTTLARDAETTDGEPVTVQRGAHFVQAIARPRPDVTVDQVRAELDTIAARLAQQYPDTNKNHPRMQVRTELDRMVGDTRQPMWILLGAVTLVLLVACANVANLLLARTADREREFAVRLAIGASRGRVIRQLLTENLLLALLGSAAGILFAYGALGLVLPLAGGGLPRLSQATVDAPVLAFCIALAVLTTILFSAPAALRIGEAAGSGSLKGRAGSSSLREGSRGAITGHDRFRNVLVIAQIAIGLVLTTGAGLLGAGFVQLMKRDLGVRPDHLLAFEFTLPEAQYTDAQQVQFHQTLREKLGSVPGVVSVGAGMPLLFSGSHMGVSFNIEARPLPPSEHPSANMAIVTPGYFNTMGTRLIAGRDFDERDRTGSKPVLVVNEAFARKFFPGENAVGKRIEPGASSSGQSKQMCEIVGIVESTRQTPLAADPEPTYYFPYPQMPWGPPAVVLRTSVEPRSLDSVVRTTFAALDPDVPIYGLRTIDELLGGQLAQPRFQLLLVGSFAAIALLLTAIGLYGVLAYSVFRRTREIGVRMALGAGRGVILQMVLGKALMLVAAGVLLGVFASVAASGLLRSMLYGVEMSAPLLTVLACGLVTITAIIAAWLPARKAASIDPMTALRAE